MMAFWILLALSVFHFALAAPVAVGEMRFNPVEVLKGGIAAWEKRVDSDDKPASEDPWWTNNAYPMHSDRVNDSGHPDNGPRSEEPEGGAPASEESATLGSSSYNDALNKEKSDDKDQWFTNDAHLMDADPGNSAHLMDVNPGDDAHLMDAEAHPWNSAGLMDTKSGTDAHLMDADPGHDSNHPGDAPGGDRKGVDAEGTNDKKTWEWGWGWPEELAILGSTNDNSLPKENSDDKKQWLKKDAHLMDADLGNDSDHPNGAPGGVAEGVATEGVKEDTMRGSEWPWISEELGTLGSDSYNALPKENSDDKKQWLKSDTHLMNADPERESPPNSEELGSGGRGPDTSNNNPPEKETASDGGGVHAMQSSQGSAENVSPGPQSEHAKIPDSEYMSSFLEKFFKMME